jgi:hypothetical protein
LDERGPLRTFAAKITAGYAFSLYNEKVEHDLHIVRVIRNAFAHSKKLLDFDDPLIIPKLLSAHYLGAVFKKHLQKEPTAVLAKAAYISICLDLVSKLLKVYTRALTASNRRYQKKFGHLSPLTEVLLGSGQPFSMGAGLAALSNTPQTSSKLNPLSFPAGQTENPSRESPRGLLSGAIPEPPKGGNKTDK